MCVHAIALGPAPPCRDSKQPGRAGEQHGVVRAPCPAERCVARAELLRCAIADTAIFFRRPSRVVKPTNCASGDQNGNCASSVPTEGGPDPDQSSLPRAPASTSAVPRTPAAGRPSTAPALATSGCARTPSPAGRVNVEGNRPTVGRAQDRPRDQNGAPHPASPRLPTRGLAALWRAPRWRRTRRYRRRE